MTIELINSDCGFDIYGIVSRSELGEVVFFEGSKSEVLSFFVGMVGAIADA